MLSLGGWPLLIALIVLFAVADRLAGGGILSPKQRPVSADWAAGILLVLVLLMVVNYRMWPFVLGWMIWRSPGWKINGEGGIRPEGSKGVAWLFVRHLLILVGVPLAWMQFGFSVVPVVWLVVWAAVAALLGVFNRKQNRNATTELLRGAAYGIAIGMMFNLHLMT